LTKWLENPQTVLKDHHEIVLSKDVHFLMIFYLSEKNALKDM